MIIRKANHGDLAVMARMWFAMVREVYPDYEPNVEWWISDALELFDSPAYMAYVIEDEDRVIGFTDATVYRDPAQGKVVAWSNHSYVVPEYRHNEETKDLYQAIYAEARERGVDIAMFNCADKLVKFWEKHGYRKVENVMMGVV